jgi:hypothetical protein
MVDVVFLMARPILTCEGYGATSRCSGVLLNTIVYILARAFPIPASPFDCMILMFAGQLTFIFNPHSFLMLEDAAGGSVPDISLSVH